MTSPLTQTDHPALRLHVRGIVQGVGFRPFVHRLASRHALAGWVRNRETGVGEHLASEVTAHAADVLPPHMVPASVVVLDSLPLTPAGKLDRRALPEPRFDVGTGEFHAPATLDEKKIAGVFSELLGVDIVTPVMRFRSILPTANFSQISPADCSESVPAGWSVSSLAALPIAPP